jgi:hypothetical protein
MCVNILGNFGLTVSSIIPQFVQTGKWYDFFTGDSIIVSDVNAPISLGPGEYKLYSTVRLPSVNLILGVEDNFFHTEDNFIRVYPNPSGGEFNFLIKNDNPAPATIKIIDISGRLIKQIETNVSDPTIPVIWDGKTAGGTEAPDGLYIVQIRIGKRTGNIKIVKN